MPPALLTWLDYSEADQRRAREIVAMFSQRESRDELGLGRIRDALSETLFPGTSVLLTRARYFLLPGAAESCIGGVHALSVKQNQSMQVNTASLIPRLLVETTSTEGLS